MYKKSKEKADQILSLYKEGKMLTEITQLTSSSQATVKKVLDLLYKDATVYLERKYETYLEMYQEFN